MAQQNKASYKARTNNLYADNTNEDITPEDLRVVSNDSADSFPFLNDIAVISEVWTHSVVVKGVVPVADEDLATKKYVDDNAGVGAGDVNGGGVSLNNEIVRYDGSTGKLIKNGNGVILSDAGDFSSVGNINFATATKTIAGIENGNLLDKISNETITGNWTHSGTTTVLAPTTDFQAATKKYVDDNIGGGDVSISGTPVNNQLAIWTSGTEIEGDSNLTWDGSTFSIGGNLSLNQLTVDNIGIDGNTISSSTGNIIFSPTGAASALILNATSGNADFSGQVIASTASGSDSVIQAYNTGNINGDRCFHMELGANAINTSSFFIVAKETGGSDMFFLFGNGDIFSAGTVTATNFILSSDIRLKENFTPLYEGSDFGTYNMIGDPQKRVGVSAQEIEKKHPEFVRHDKEGMKSVAYIDLYGYKIAELEKEIIELKKR